MEAAGKPVFAINLFTLDVSHFCARSEAGRELGLDGSRITAVIKGKRNHTGGFWFVNDDNNAADTIKQKLHEIKHRSTLKKYAI